MRIRFFLLIGLLGLLIPAEATSQFPSGGSRGGFGDPSKLFDMMSGGRDVVTRDSLPNPLFAGMFDRFAQQMGVTDGKLTREQFNAYMQQKAAEKAAGGAPSDTSSPSGGGFRSSGKEGGGGPPPWAGGFKGGDGKGDPNQGEMADRWADSMFRRADANGDGLLNYDEMSESLRTELDKWDANKDGFVDANEYKAYFTAVIEQRLSERGGGSPGMGGGTPENPPIEEDEPKPVVYRAGKLPKELPAWFKTADADADGQITMYEWRTGGKTLDEFQRMDRNGDGFLTIAEVMYFTVGKNNLNGVAIASASESKAAGAAASETKSGTERPSFGSPSSDRGGFGGRPSFGGSSDKGSGRPSPFGGRGR